VPGEHLEAYAAGGEVVDGVDQMMQTPAELVELPHDEGVALPQRLQAGGETGTVVASARSQILVEPVGVDAGGEQRVTLRVEGL